MIELGADVTAIDYVAKTTTGFWVVERCLGKEIEHHNINAFDIDPNHFGKFDIVLLLGVLYHLPDMCRMLYLARQLTKSRLFVESHVEDFESEVWFARYLPRRAVRHLTKSRHANAPLARYLPRDTLRHDNTNFWAPNVACLVEMLKDCGFNVLRVERWQNRALIEAEPSFDKSRYQKFDLGYGLRA